MQTKLAGLLLAHAPLAALVGNRIQWDTLPQGSPQPSIVMYVISGVTDYTMAGASGYVQTRVQFDCRGAKTSTKSGAAAAREVAEALNKCLSGFRGEFGGYRFQGCFAQGQRTRFDKDSASEWFTDSRDFILHWSPA
ncbi:MAG: tail completion protein gp17 [Cypionkella sp.]